MTVNWVAAIIAGLIATVAMTVLMYMGKSMGMRMDLPRMLGLMFVGPENGGAVAVIGWIAHLMMGVIFAIIYALIFAALAITR